MTLPQIYLILSTVLLGFICMIWSRKDFINVTIKLVFGIVCFMGAYTIIISRVFG